MHEITNIYLRELFDNKQIDNVDIICLAAGEKCMLSYQPAFKRIVFTAYGRGFEIAVSQDLMTALLFDLKAETLNGNRVYYITIHNRIFNLKPSK